MAGGGLHPRGPLGGDMTAAARASAIFARNVSKTFGATVALAGASFGAEAGEVHALLGENGAGKSTLVKMLSGLVQPNSGDILIGDKDVNLKSIRDAHSHGIQTAFQELTLVPDLTVTQNMLLPYQPTGYAGQLRDRYGLNLVVDHLERLGLRELNPHAEVRDLDLGVRQKIEIARALFRKPNILLLDEPTSSLSGRDIDWLGDIIAEQKARGVAVVFITHRIREVRAFCDRITILRNGKDVGAFKIDEVSDEVVIELIIGRSMAQTFPSKVTVDPGAATVLAAHDIAAGHRLEHASFELRRGEVVGVAGLQGMGQQELFLGAFGAIPLVRGSIEVGGRALTLTSPADAITAGVGISLVPEERKTEALFLNLDGRRNVSMPIVDKFVRFGLIDEKSETKAVGAVLERIRVDLRALYTKVSSFSGGNQQKIAIAKWLMADSHVLLMFDPTRGVDVGTKHEIYVLIRDFVAAGGAVLLYSTEIPELVNLSHRVIVMYAGRVVSELADSRNELDEAGIMRAVLGAGANARANIPAEN
jgi:ribose transport system ATP-binding protein